MSVRAMMDQVRRILFVGFVIFTLFPQLQPLQATSHTNPFVDLTISAIAVDAQTHVPTFMITNLGTKETNLTTTQGQGVKLSYTWKGDAEFGPYTIDLREAIGILYINQSVQVKGQPPPFVSSGPRISEIAGHISTEYFVDRNPNNNTRTQPVTPFVVENDGTLPDLTIESVTFDQQSLAPTVTIRNIGWGRAYLGAGDPSYVRLNYSWLTAAGTTVGQNTPPLQTGGRYLAYNETVVVTLPFPPNRQQEIYRRFFIDIDIPSKVRETDDEGNNRRSIPVEEADLQISTVSHDPVSRQPTMTIINAGRAPAILGPAKLFYQYLSQTGTELRSGSLSINQASGQTTIPGNGSISFQLPVPGDDAYALKALVDSDNTVTEKYDDNNRYEGTFPELQPDIIIDWISFQQRGTLVDILLGVKNIGKKFCNFSNAASFRLSWRNTHEDEVGSEDIPVTRAEGALGTVSPGVTKQVKLPDITAPGDSFQLFVTVHPGCTEPGGNNTKSEYTPWNTLPDLIISDGGFSQAHISPYFITVKNVGIAKAQIYQKDNIEQTRVQVTVGWQNMLGRVLTSQTQGISSQEDTIDINGTRSTNLFPDPPPAGAFYLYAIVDEPGNRVPELNEDNNTFRFIANLPNNPTIVQETQASAAASTLIDTFDLEGLRKPKDATKSAWIYKPLNLDFTKAEERLRASAEHAVQDFFEALNPRRKDKIKNREKRAVVDLLKAKGFLEEGELGLAEDRLRRYGDHLTKAGTYLSDLQKKNPEEARRLASDLVEQELSQTLILNAMSQAANGFAPVLEQAQDKINKLLGGALGAAGETGTQKIFKHVLTKNPSPLVALSYQQTLGGIRANLPEGIGRTLAQEEPEFFIKLKTFSEDQPVPTRKFIADYIETVADEQEGELISILDLENIDEIAEADPLPSPSFPTDNLDWQSFFPPGILKELEDTLGPLIGQITALCGKLPQTDAEAQECAQKILGGSLTLPELDSTEPLETGPIVIPTIDPGMYE